MASHDTAGTAGHSLRTALDLAGITYRIDSCRGVLSTLDIPDDTGNVFIISLPDSTEIRITDEDGSTVYGAEEHRGWKVLRYIRPEDDIHTCTVYDSDNTDVDTDSRTAVSAIVEFVASLTPDR
ncbi:hypothetical protein [Streptomyces albipurpureus]|uniref:Uncharacterized protein n=1 Tax=Streptomyces albipurpureus TaxID=2897419 RepID=A0ABT0UN28_9ACTN|nr:hypothetical protein [Streptomyces sp. CWNU-1]MCM2388808.1 hypothetical protein [Streptomyces sp. CWNU-1]